jgi:sugar phosphate isomerase/epimerase
LKSANKGFKFQEKFHSKAEFDRTLSPNDSSLGVGVRLANLNGSRPAPEDAKFAGCLPKTIEPVGDGDFPLTQFVQALADVGYSGPVGFQGYNIGGHPPETLARSIEAWRSA